MSNLDVALTLRLINGLSGPAKAAVADLKALAGQAKALDGAHGKALATDLARDASAATKTGAALRQAAAEAGRLTTAGRATATLGQGLTAAAAGGARTGAGLRQVATEAGKISTSGQAITVLGAELSAAAAAGSRLDAALKGIASGRAGLAALAASTKSLTVDLDKAASALGRVKRPAAGTGERTGRERVAGAGAADGVAAAGLGRVGAIAAPAALAYGASRTFATYAEVERRLTRIGITGEASREEMRAVMVEAQQLAQSTGMSLAQVVGGYDALATQGKKMGDIRAFMPAVASTAQASGAEVSDIANAAGAISEQMDITAKRMQSAFDIMVQGGNEGKFELKDMARYLPSLAPLAASVGMKGEEGLKRLVAMLQVVRNQTGTAEEAASSMNNIFAKMESEETTKRFKKFGVDLRKEMKDAREGGKDLLTTFVELSDRAIKGDVSKLPQLFSDMEFARGMRALLSQKGAVDQLVTTLGKADGSTLAALNRVLGDSKTKIDQLSNSWETFKTRIGEALAPAIVPALATINNALKTVVDASEKQPVAPGKGLSDASLTKLNKFANLAIYGDTLGGEPPFVAYARAGAHRTEGDVAKAKLREDIGREEADVAQSEGAPLAFLRRDLIAAGKQRIASMRERLTAIDTAVAAIDAALAELDTSKARARSYETARIRQGKEGLDPYAEGSARSPEFGLFPTRDAKRNLSFGINGAPNIRPVFGPENARDAAPDAPLPPSRPADAARLLDRIEDVLNGRRTATRRDVDASGGSFALTGPRTMKGADFGVPRSGPATFPLSLDVGQLGSAAGQVKSALTLDLAQAATTSIASYDGALLSGLSSTAAAVAAKVAEIKAELSFTATPIIAPRIQAPSGGVSPASAPSAPSLGGGTRSAGVSIGTVHVHGATDLAGIHQETLRVADRHARDERNDALHDLGGFV